MNKIILLIALLLAGCTNEPQVEREELPILSLPEKPSFDCTEIRWYYINEKLALDIKDFQYVHNKKSANFLKLFKLIDFN